MALFDKPFRYVPQIDPADIVSGEDVAVVDSVAPVEPAPAAPAAAIAPPTLNAPAPAAAEGSVAPQPTAPIEPPVADPPKGAIEPPIADPPKVTIEPPVADLSEVAIEPLAADLPEVTIDPPATDLPEVTIEPPPVEAIVEPLQPSVEIPVVASRTTPSAEPVIAAAANQPAVELVAREERSLRPASDGGGLTVFSRVVPSAPNPPSPGDTQRLVNAIDETDPVLDQLRSLAATLHQARTGRELKVIAVTSSISGEGKTLLAANLALTLSRSYMRQVLLIDVDLRRPSLHRLFGIPSQEGIRTALDSVREGTPVAVQEVGPRLALLPAGKPVRDPISVLASDAMQRLMTAATNAFDWVILDTPPVGMLPDVSLLSSLSDAVLLVVEAGAVRYDLVQRTVESIGADRIFGVVLNKVPERDIVASYGMHYYAPYR